jgi:hypothetical protein
MNAASCSRANAATVRGARPITAVPVGGTSAATPREWRA